MAALGFRIKGFIDNIDNLSNPSDEERSMAMQLLGEAFLQGNKNLFETKEALEDAVKDNYFYKTLVCEDLTDKTAH